MGSVEEIIFDAMHDILGDELVFWKTVAAIRDRRKKMKLFTNATVLLTSFVIVAIALAGISRRLFGWP